MTTTSSSSPASTPPGAWQRAAGSSSLWHALSPLRDVWSAIEAAIARATAAPATADAERRVERVVASSWLGRTAERLAGTAAVASEHGVIVSWCREWLQPLSQQHAGVRLREAGQVVLIAAVTALALQALTPRHAALTWIVPVAAAAVAAIAMFFADRFDAAWKDKR